MPKFRRCESELVGDQPTLTDVTHWFVYDSMSFTSTSESSLFGV